MATISLTYTGTNATLTRAVDLNAQFYGYQETVNGQPNPESKQEFVRKTLLKVLLGQANEQEKKNSFQEALESITPVNGVT